MILLFKTLEKSLSRLDNIEQFRAFGGIDKHVDVGTCYKVVFLARNKDGSADARVFLLDRDLSSS
jgi:hypothetical protein